MWILTEALRRTARLAAFVFVIGVAASARADDVDRTKDDAGLGMATVLANVFYMPVKVGFAAVGGVTGGLGYVLTGGNKQIAKRVWVSSLGGDYVLSREMVAGDEEIRFAGQNDADM
jgi:hypothetical protein